jgi:hypothetical protein
VENAFGYYINTPGALDAHLGWDEVNKLYRQHATPQQLFDLNLVTSEQWNNYYKFIIIRNSWSKLLSDYFWISRVNKIDDSFKNFLLKKGNFERVLTDNRRSDFCGDHLYSQKDYFFLNNEPINYDTIIDFDEIEQGFKKVVKDLNLDHDFFRKIENVSKNKINHYSYFYTIKTKKLMDVLYKEDIEYFKFTFKNKTGLPLIFNRRKV